MSGRSKSPLEDPDTFVPWFLGVNSVRFASSFILLVVSLLASVAQPGLAQDEALIETNAMDIPPDVAIKVGNDTVSRDEFLGRVKKRLATVKKSKQLPDTADMQNIRDGVKETLRRQIVNRMVVRYHALNSGMPVPDTMVEKVLDESIKEAGSREKFMKQLSERGSSMGEQRDRIRRKILMRRYLEKNVKKPTVTDTEIRRVYEANKGRISSSFEEFAPRLRKMIRKKKYDRATAQYLRKLKRKTEIKVNISDL